MLVLLPSPDTCKQQERFVRNLVFIPSLSVRRVTEAKAQYGHKLRAQSPGLLWQNYKSTAAYCRNRKKVNCTCTNQWAINSLALASRSITYQYSFPSRHVLNLVELTLHSTPLYEYCTLSHLYHHFSPGSRYNTTIW
jgi:hypothetical protein